MLSREKESENEIERKRKKGRSRQIGSETQSCLAQQRKQQPSVCNDTPPLEHRGAGSASASEAPLSPALTTKTVFTGQLAHCRVTFNTQTGHAHSCREKSKMPSFNWQSFDLVARTP